ncbi:MAG: SLC13 family permease [Gammaproteobacteria bacterium]|nr:SLC13 family permease [Gammaproteobacteria bacterium]
MDVNIKQTTLWLGPVIALFAGFMASWLGLDNSASITLGITVLVILWWVFEPIPIPATSLIPLTAFPLLGVLTSVEVAQAYGDKLVLLLLGGFILSQAMERSGAHLRVALNMVRLFGNSSSRRLVFGFMAAAALLSMWISNTATTLMLLPVALAVISQSPDKKLATPLLLGCAYAASIGGIGTPIGTPPNIVFSGVYQQIVGQEISFATWMSWGVPVVLVFLPIAGFWLTRNLTFKGQVQMPEVGSWKPVEIRVMVIFALTALAWVTRQEPFGGWSTWFNTPSANDAVVALFAVILMFIIPDGKGSRLLDWETANKIPWGMLILFGAGISIAKAFVASGLSEELGLALTQLSALHVFVMMAVICVSVTFLTECTSNTATTTLLMPILAAAAVGAGADPKLLMVPAAMSASCAFMLPVATPPNVIMFSTGRIEIQTMVQEGVVLNFIGVALISTLCYFLLT